MSASFISSREGQLRTRRIGILCVGAAALMILFSGIVKGDYYRFIFASVAFNAITVLSISMLAGATGIWSLGSAAFIAVGAYVSTNMASAGVPIEIILPVIACISAALGYLLGTTAGRFSTLYFGLLTLAVALSAVEIIGRLSSFTGGDQGMSVAPMKSWILGKALDSTDAPWVSVVLATLMFLVADLVVKGAPGRRWRAVKSQRTASTAIGFVPYVANANAFAFSAAIASVGGVAAAITLGFLDPQIFNLSSGIMLIVGAVVGGIGSFLGAVVGALFIVGIPELGRNFPDVAAFALGSTMILVLLVLPKGIAPTIWLRVQKVFGKERRPVAGLISRAADAAMVSRLARDLMPACRVGLRIHGLSVSFGGLKVLQNVSLEVPPGKTVGLIGPNGAGKTTLINVLSGFVSPSKCELLQFGDSNLLKQPAHTRIIKGLGRTFQHAELFDDLTIREMLTVAAEQRKHFLSTKPTNKLSTSEIVDRVLDGLNLREVENAHPEELPFGVKKVADIARTLAVGAMFVALDEPFSGLDSGEIAELRAILAGMKAAGVSILIIDHAVQEIMAIADEVVVLNFGTVLAHGSPSEISSNAEVQEAYFGSTFKARTELTSAPVGDISRKPLMELCSVGHHYSGVVALDNVSILLEAGSFTAILGPNGAGKSTLAQILGGLMSSTTGDLFYGGSPRKVDVARGAVSDGICLVPEGRRLFGQLTIKENLVAAGYGIGLNKKAMRERINEVSKILPPALSSDMDSRFCMSLSGGERQILALCRALISRPQLIILDEPSMGLAPVMVDRVYKVLSELNAKGTAVVVIEQIATHATEHAEKLYILSRGKVAYCGPARGQSAVDAIQLSYLGHAEANSSS